MPSQNGSGQASSSMNDPTVQRVLKEQAQTPVSGPAVAPTGSPGRGFGDNPQGPFTGPSGPPMGPAPYTPAPPGSPGVPMPYGGPGIGIGGPITPVAPRDAPYTPPPTAPPPPPGPTSAFARTGLGAPTSYASTQNSPWLGNGQGGVSMAAPQAAGTTATTGAAPASFAARTGGPLPGQPPPPATQQAGMDAAARAKKPPVQNAWGNFGGGGTNI